MMVNMLKIVLFTDDKYPIFKIDKQIHNLHNVNDTTANSLLVHCKQSCAQQKYYLVANNAKRVKFVFIILFHTWNTKNILNLT